MENASVVRDAVPPEDRLPTTALGAEAGGLRFGCTFVQHEVARRRVEIPFVRLSGDDDDFISWIRILEQRGFGKAFDFPRRW